MCIAYDAYSVFLRNAYFLKLFLPKHYRRVNWMSLFFRIELIELLIKHWNTKYRFLRKQLILFLNHLLWVCYKYLFILFIGCFVIKLYNGTYKTHYRITRDRVDLNVRFDKGSHGIDPRGTRFLKGSFRYSVKASH